MLRLLRNAKKKNHTAYHKLILWSWLSLEYHLLFLRWGAGRWFLVTFSHILLITTPNLAHTLKPLVTHVLSLSPAPSHLNQDTRGHQPQSWFSGSPCHPGLLPQSHLLSYLQLLFQAQKMDSPLPPPVLGQPTLLAACGDPIYLFSLYLLSLTLPMPHFHLTK